MKKNTVGVFAVCVIALGLAGWKHYSQRQNRDILHDFTHWHPSNREVQLSMQSYHTASTKNALKHFAQLITQRYRGHNPPFAVLIRYKNPTYLKLECPARMAPWNMNRLAVDLWREAHNDLNQNITVGIYRTYIGAKPYLIGTLVPAQSGSTTIASINYTGLNTMPRFAPPARVEYYAPFCCGFQG